MENIAIFGLGYVGLPLAVELGKSFPVKGFDLNRSRVQELDEGFDRTNECSVSELRAATNLSFLHDPEELRGSTFFIVTVPTPVDDAKIPDLEPIRRASKRIGSLLASGGVVVYESTVFPGATEEICVPILESESGLAYNKDFFCGYSPERINPGDKKHRIDSITKIVSGSAPAALRRIKAVYSKIIKAGLHEASSIRVAEAAKVIENTQRDVNIALVNELSVLFSKMGISTQEVLEAASTKWNFLPFKPGLVGGHCIGVDPYYLTYKAQQMGCYPEMILAGRRVNDSMAREVAVRTVKLMSSSNIPITGSRVLVLGTAFKPNCPDMRNSKVVDLVQELESFSLKVDAYDPLVDAEELSRCFPHGAITALENGIYDGIVIAVAHEELVCRGSVEIRRLGRKNHVIFDVMGYFPASQTDDRL